MFRVGEVHVTHAKHKINMAMHNFIIIRLAVMFAVWLLLFLDHSSLVNMTPISKFINTDNTDTIADVIKSIFNRIRRWYGVASSWPHS